MHIASVVLSTTILYSVLSLDNWPFTVGYASFRHPEYGSPFIRCLVDVFLTNACDTEMRDLGDKVRSYVYDIISLCLCICIYVCLMFVFVYLYIYAYLSMSIYNY